jgi:ubiquinone/menaquinone biosynthesis C-methylase UbiE
VAPESAPFEVVAATYDEVFSDTFIGRAQRKLVWREIDRLFQPGQRILEINCGTGVDALHLAGRGVRVVACDAALGMLAAARTRCEQSDARTQVEFRLLKTEAIGQLEGDAPFDGALSNFAGLNCVEDLSAVAGQLARLLKPDAKLALCVFGRYCLWEILWYLAHGKPHKALRRFQAGGTVATLAGRTTVRVQYPSVRTLQHTFAPHFFLTGWKGVGIVIPPSYLEFLGLRYPRAFLVAAELEPQLSSVPVVRNLADHVVLTFERSRQ